MVFNVYNDCHNSDSIDQLQMHLHSHAQGPGHGITGATYSMWYGDFNQHHPMWDERNHHLFTAQALEKSLKLITLVANHNMYMVLPKDIPTLESMSTKNWTQLDNIFCSTGLSDSIICCMTSPGLRGPGTDHVPILMALEFLVERVSNEIGCNFQEVEWDAFLSKLGTRLAGVPSPTPLHTEEELMLAINGLMEAIQSTIYAVVPKRHPPPYSK